MRPVRPLHSKPRVRRLLATASVFAAGGLMLLPAPGTAAEPAAPAAAVADVPEGTYQLVNVQTGKCATVAGGSTTANNHPLVQFDCDTHPSRRWQVTNEEDGAFQLVNGQTGKCATVAGGTTTANNHPLVQFDCDTHPSRRWRITNGDGRSFQLVNAQTGKCATVAGGTTTANNHPLVQFDCDTHPSRRWFLRLVD
ncbi:RICIN domain-containing protein [Streptomyces sp. WAC07061]|uniref:RICIN domain-containing protein n=1 Tax=Streptomyces sp. WAC07061 TaxID=2487410 RepID=UPI0021AF560C|nr:RICIN domain-containing protein [Streptomyces sp. WAC07061]